MYIYIHTHPHTHISRLPTPLASASGVQHPVESRIIPKGGFGLTPGKLFTRSKPKPCPKYLLTPSHK